MPTPEPWIASFCASLRILVGLKALFCGKEATTHGFAETAFARPCRCRGRFDVTPWIAAPSPPGQVGLPRPSRGTGLA